MMIFGRLQHEPNSPTRQDCVMNMALARLLTFFAIGFWSCMSWAQAPAPGTPVLPPPTEAQLQKGRAILEKMLHIVKSVPLSKPSEVFRVFGVDQPDMYPDRFRNGDFVLIQINAYGEKNRGTLREQGLLSLSADYHFDKTLRPDSLALGFTSELACVSIDDVHKLFLPISSRVDNPKRTPTLRIDDFTPTPAPMHEYKSMSIEIADSIAPYQTRVGFRFDHQICAEAASIINTYNFSKVLKK